MLRRGWRSAVCADTDARTRVELNLQRVVPRHTPHAHTVRSSRLGKLRILQSPISRSSRLVSPLNRPSGSRWSLPRLLAPERAILLSCFCPLKKSSGSVASFLRVQNVYVSARRRSPSKKRTGKAKRSVLERVATHKHRRRTTIATAAAAAATTTLPPSRAGEHRRRPRCAC